MERTTDVDTMQVKYAFSGVQLAGAAVLAVLLGFVGALGGKMYTHHNDQHWYAEQKLREQELINQNLVNAINQLAARLPK